ncbi:uncharacterized protein LOC110862339 [Folsomia candida]|uniref:Uncharacterized protein n=1 Tax=Folsomia candida TaxID=158441 RepID=A0A226CY07_FOLCA|nr:uncharacterized protein LOC110862339 [Folsomia candida]OXA37670.1 hypothetical protein Fcan01_27569 [Folsomia candida]
MKSFSFPSSSMSFLLLLWGTLLFVNNLSVAVSSTDGNINNNNFVGLGPSDKLWKSPSPVNTPFANGKSDKEDGNAMENEIVKLLPEENQPVVNLVEPDYFDDEIDIDYEDICQAGFWWHLRGHRCVPVKCLGGNKLRDPATGECIRKSRRKFNKSPRNYFSRMSSHRRFVPNLKQFGGRIFRK